MHSQFFNTLLAAVASAKLPYKRQLAYLESVSGTRQYIDTGIAFDKFADLEIVGRVERPNTSRSVIIGNYQGTTDCVNIEGSAGWNNLRMYLMGGSGSLDKTISGGFPGNTVVDFHFAFAGSNAVATLTANGGQASGTLARNELVNSLNFRLFSDPRSSPTGLLNALRIYSLSIISAGSLVRDFIPVIDWNDTPCMYDKVSKQLFYNQGTGEFLIAPADWRDDEVFTIDLNITSDNLQFGVTPHWNAGGWCNILDWGDGSTQAATTSGTQLTHTYAAVGSYRVKVRGDMYRFRVGSTNPAAVIDCNGNWEALGNITNGVDMFVDCANGVFAFTALPTTLTNASAMFLNCIAATLPLGTLPAGLTGSLMNFFNNCKAMAMDISEFSKTLPEYPGVYNITQLFTGCRHVSGSAATFLRKFPGVNQGITPFSNTSVTAFGTDDYFEITLTTTEANQVWGFTPTSSAGRWYYVQWGSSAPNRNPVFFTSGTKVSHTFATPGTYHIKLATAPCSIVFDPYDSDNGNYEALGWPLDNVAGVFVKEGATTVSSAMTMSGATITSGQSQMVYNRGVGLDCTVLSGGYQSVKSGGLLVDNITSQGGSTFISSGGVISGGSAFAYLGVQGTAYDIYNGGAQIFIRPGGIISGLTVSNATPVVSVGASAIDVINLRLGNIYHHGYMLRLTNYANVTCDGEIISAICHSGQILVGSEGIVNSAITDGGNILASSGGYIYSAVASSGGWLRCSQGGVLSAAVIDSLGSLTVYSGGTALAVTSNAGATVTVLNGGYIEYVTP